MAPAKAVRLYSVHRAQEVEQTLRRTVEGHAHAVQQVDNRGGGLAHRLHRRLIRQKVATIDRVVEVLVGTDAPTNMTWDATETVWDGSTDYTGVHDPALCADSTERLFAIGSQIKHPPVSTRSFPRCARLPRAPGLPPQSLRRRLPISTMFIFHLNRFCFPARPLRMSPWSDGNRRGHIGRIVAHGPNGVPAETAGSGATETTQDPDVLCIAKPYTYSVLFAYSWDNSAAGNIGTSHSSMPISRPHRVFDFHANYLIRARIGPLFRPLESPRFSAYCLSIP